MAHAVATMAIPTSCSSRLNLPSTLLQRCPSLQLQQHRLQAAPLKFFRSRFSVRATAAVESTAQDTIAEEASEDITTKEEAEDVPAEPLPLPTQKIRVYVRAYYSNWVEEGTKMIVDAVRGTGAQIGGPIPLPTKRKVFCVLRSPFADGKHKQHWQIKFHKRLIEIKNPTPRTIDALLQLVTPFNCQVDIKL